MLSEDAVARYREQGLIVPDARIDAATVDRIIDLADDLFRAHPGLSRDFAASLIERDRRWLEIAGLPVILDCLSDLIGGHFLCWGSSIFGKPARTGKQTPWHQDGRYWPIKPLAACTVWIALDRSTPENGCLRIVPGSHRDRKLRDHERNDSEDLTLNQELDIEAENQARDVILDSGQLAIFDCFLVHGSRANLSDRPRRGLTLQYMPTSSHFDHDWAARNIAELNGLDLSQRQLQLMRGRDLCGKNDFERGKVAAAAAALQ